MRKFLSSPKNTRILLTVTVILLGFLVYMMARPVSYGMGYHNETVYEGELFEGTMKFYPDGTLINRNTTFNEEMQSRYYYKNGYVFFTLSETDEAYEKEVAYIDENFEDAVNSPFYACKINTFQMVSVGPDGYTMVYTCMPAIVFVIAFGIVELIFIGLTAYSFLLCKKKGSDE